MGDVMAKTAIHGSVAAGFEGVSDSFARGFEKGELGAAVSAYVDGRNVVDLWGGWADAERTREWAHDTIVPTYSATKGMTATCAHLLVDRGALDVDEPVTTYWPEFGQSGKEKITVRMVLSHQAGLKHVIVPDGTSSVVSGMVIAQEKRFDWAAVTDALARSSPGWEPGTRWEYHGPTFGYLVGEIVRRIDGRPLDVFFRQEIADPLGAEFMISVPPEEDHRCADALGDEASGAVPPVSDPWIKNGQFVWVNVNTRVWRSAADGASTGFGSADGLARVYAMLANGGQLDGERLLRAETIAAAAQEQPLANADGAVEGFGLGYALLWKDYPDLPVGAFGHPGSGGSLGLADPTRRLSFGYVMNQMGSNGAAHLLRALYRSLDG